MEVRSQCDILTSFSKVLQMLCRFIGMLGVGVHVNKLLDESVANAVQIYRHVGSGNRVHVNTSSRAAKFHLVRKH